jgi:hypothetical protein
MTHPIRAPSRPPRPDGHGPWCRRRRVSAQDVVKIGQIEAQTGANAIYGWMPAGRGAAVDDQQGGRFKVGNKTYKLQPIALDTRESPRRRRSSSAAGRGTRRSTSRPVLSNVFSPSGRTRPSSMASSSCGRCRIHDYVGIPAMSS